MDFEVSVKNKQQNASHQPISDQAINLLLYLEDTKQLLHEFEFGELSILYNEEVLESMPAVSFRHVYQELASRKWITDVKDALKVNSKMFNAEKIQQHLGVLFPALPMVFEKDQALNLLSHLTAENLLETAFDYSNLLNIYNQQIMNIDPTISFGDVLYQLRCEKSVLASPAKTPHAIKFNKQRVNKLLAANITDMFANMSINEDPKPKKEGKKSTNSPKVNPTNIPAASSKIKNVSKKASVQNIIPKASSTSANGMSSNSQLVQRDISSKSKPSKKTQKPAAQNSTSTATKPNTPKSRLSSNAQVLQTSTPTKQGVRKKPPKIFLDQRYGFKLCDIANCTNLKAIDPLCCLVCGDVFSNFPDMNKHKKTDIHLFKKIFQASVKNENYVFGNTPPKVLNGKDHGIMVQSARGCEGRSVKHVNLLQNNNGSVPNKMVPLMVHFKPVDNQATKVALMHTFLILGGPKIRVFEEKFSKQYLRTDKPIVRNLKILENEIGSYDCIVAFKFLKLDEPPFFVMKHVCVRIDNFATVENGKAIKTLPSVKRDQEEHFNADFVLNLPNIVEVAKAPPKPKYLLKNKQRLKNYPLPANYRSFFNVGFDSDVNTSLMALEQKHEVLNILLKGLSEENHDRFFSLLLYLEEHQTMCDLLMYSMKNAPLFSVQSNRKLVALDVPGLAEDRPSVLKGDEIYFTLFQNKKYQTFKGWVYKVCNTKLHVGMGSRFMDKFVDNMKVTVHFSFARLSTRTEHRAVELLTAKKQVARICFPTTFGAYEKVKPIKRWINPNIQNNPEQAQAVQNILNGASLPSPYLLFGPPGTGKTVTLVETIQQIFYSSEETCVLAAAPSNSASDLIAERLLKAVPASQLIRLYSPSRDWAHVPLSLRKSCNFYQGECCFPALEMLKKYRIIVATLICCGRLVSGGFPPGHFTHIFVDECGHGSEPTALVPVAGLLSTQPRPTQLVLSGDPRQLGPIIRSPIAKRLGFAQSLLERLMTLDLYKKQEDGKYNPQVLTKLVMNFRSHPDILKVPNDLFYDGDLQACGDVGVTYSACEWIELPTKGVPLIFHGVEGKDAQDEGSPSFFNISEVNLVVKYAQKVLGAKFRGQKLKASDIGIISPYRRQIDKIHRALERSKLHGLSVGSVEEFQGQERRIIIVSTVRSNPAKLALDRKFRLGFLREPKRFNVAITRAKALLIVIGNPNILQQDPNWRSLLEYSIKRGGYTGCPFKLSSTEDVLQPMDQDELRVPVREKLEKQFSIIDEALSLKPSNGDNWGQNVDVNKFLQQIKDVGLFTVVGDVSELENEVSPPIRNAE